MAYKFFDTLLDSKAKGARTKRKLTLPVSIGIHLVVLARRVSKNLYAIRRPRYPGE